MRKQIVGSSWKMHINSINMAEETGKDLNKLLSDESRVEMFILPSFPMIPKLSEILKNSCIKYGAQNMCYEEKGAFTGEVPPLVLKELGCSYVEIGHAERRSYFNERDESINKKVRLAFKYGMIPVVCIGEEERDKKENIGKIKIRSQILWALNGLTKEDAQEVILAYEPVWAIGKEEAASVDYVENMHGYIRDIVKKELGEEVSKNIRIIYGGSVSPENSKELSKKENIDGVFVGRFGLRAENFKSIVDNFKKSKIK
ncbi:MAG: triose-phosphate isomerase [Clostridiaceae bacterium]